MQISTTQFDTERLYTTAWVAPHHDHLDFAPPPPQWERSRAGVILELEMDARGLTIYDLTISINKSRLIVAGPRSLEPSTVSLSMKRPSAASVGELKQLLDLVCANLARERMMRAVGWARGAPEPAWAQLTTELTEHVLRLGGYCSYDLWSLPRHCADMFGRIDAPDRMTGDARDALPLGFQALRVGPLLRLEGSFGKGIRVAQGTCTLIVMPHAGLRVADNRTKRRPVVQDFGSVGSGPIALYLNRRAVRRLLHQSLIVTDTRLVEIEMPVITMDEIPEEALRAVGLRVPREFRRYPYWAIISRLGQVDPVSPRFTFP